MLRGLLTSGSESADVGCWPCLQLQRTATRGHHAPCAEEAALLTTQLQSKKGLLSEGSTQGRGSASPGLSVALPGFAKWLAKQNWKEGV